MELKRMRALLEVYSTVFPETDRLLIPMGCDEDEFFGKVQECIERGHPMTAEELEKWYPSDPNVLI